jgi:mRNA-degrading endonuclease RelE of RelBE toxin-antitoxin system
MIIFEFTKKSFKQFQKLDQSAQSLVKEKLTLLKDPEIFNKNSKQLTDLNPATHRIRIGRYRALLKQNSAKNYIILKLKHRKDIYR